MEVAIKGKYIPMPGAEKERNCDGCPVRLRCSFSVYPGSRPCRSLRGEDLDAKDFVPTQPTNEGRKCRVCKEDKNMYGGCKCNGYAHAGAVPPTEEEELRGEMIPKAMADEPALSAEEGRKDDAGKPRWSLLPWNALKEVVKVYTEGAKKYAAHNWKKVEDGEERYFDALLRHVEARETEGLINEKDFGLLHSAHIAWNALALVWFDLKKLGK